MLSLRATAFALVGTGTGFWSLRTAAAVPTWPTALPGDGTISVRKLASRFSGAGAALRALSKGTTNLWTHANLLTDGGDDDEEEMWWRLSAHKAGEAPSGFGDKFHSKDDDIPPTIGLSISAVSTSAPTLPTTIRSPSGSGRGAANKR